MKCLWILFLLCFFMNLAFSAKAEHRVKRDAGSVISIATQIAPLAYDLVRELLPKKSCGRRIKMSRVNDMYNNNMANSQSLKDRLVARMPSAADAIHMNPNGFYCNEEFCNEVGSNVMGTLGICSSNYCKCVDGQAVLLVCGRNEIFDPKNGSCVYYKQAMFCY